MGQFIVILTIIVMVVRAVVNANRKNPPSTPTGRTVGEILDNQEDTMPWDTHMEPEKWPEDTPETAPQVKSQPASEPETAPVKPVSKPQSAPTAPLKPVTIAPESQENQGMELDAEDIKKAVIYSEILRRPDY